MPKTPIDIERLLQWAYRDELPKREIGGLTGWESDILLLGTRIDTSGYDRGEPGFPVAMGPPHPDALMIDYQVRALPEIKIDWEATSAILMGHLSSYVDVRDFAISALGFELPALVQMHARMGTRPDWRVGEIKLKRVNGANGKPVVNGLTRGGRYGSGAHSPLQLDPPATEIACARAEYMAWRSALQWLVDEKWSLESYVVTAPAAAEAPWLADIERRARVLASSIRTTVPAITPRDRKTAPQLRTRTGDAGRYVLRDGKPA
jgi:hypothetical protein